MNYEELKHFPEFLRTYENMVRHFDEQVGDLPDVEKGELFEKFTLDLLGYKG